MAHHQIPSALATGAPVPAQRLVAYMHMSQQLIRDAPSFGRPESETDAERQARRDAAATYRERRAAAVEAAHRAHAELVDEVGPGAVREVLALHGPTADLKCEGCDMSGYDCEEPFWPCSTYELVAKHHGRTFVESWPMTAMDRVNCERVQ